MQRLNHARGDGGQAAWQDVDKSSTCRVREGPRADEEDEDDEEYDSPLEPPEELSDNDFDWDSDM